MERLGQANLPQAAHKAHRPATPESGMYQTIDQVRPNQMAYADPAAMRWQAFAQMSAGLLIVAAVTYAFLLCFVHTKLFYVSPALFMAVDGLITVGAFAIAFTRAHKPLRIAVALMMLHFLMVGALSGDWDLKTFRDPLVIFAFLYLGITYGTAQFGQKLVFVIGALVIGVGLWEYLALDHYTSNFDILQFYIDRGVIDPRVREWYTGKLFVSGLRFEDRNLLPFLGEHRVASVFLEPVSMGNFGAIIAAWGLAQPRVRTWTFALTMLIAAAGIIMPDARFGSMVVMFFVAARFLPLRYAPLVIAAAPFVVATFLLFWGAFSGVGMGDDLPTRLAISGRAMLNMDLAQLFGMSTAPLVTLDSGYYYALRTFGLHGCLILWLAFNLLRPQHPQALRFQLFVAIYLSLLLSISGGSMFAVKTSALMWFLLGALCVSPAPTGPARPAFQR